MSDKEILDWIKKVSFDCLMKPQNILTMAHETDEDVKGFELDIAINTFFPDLSYSLS